MTHSKKYVREERKRVHKAMVKEKLKTGYVTKTLYGEP